MDDTGRFQGTIHHVTSQWLAYLLLYAGLVLALVTLGYGAVQGQSGTLLLGLGSTLLLLYFLATSLWTAHRQFDGAAAQAHETLFRMSQAVATDRLLYVDLGLRHGPLALARHLTTGAIIVVDIFNPQLTPGPALKRERRRAPAARNDPRLVWYDSNIDLLPLPDRGVKFVFLNQVLSEIAQRGDREVLLREVYRVLKPNGRLLLAERAGESHWLTSGLATLEVAPAAYWRELLTAAHFEIRREEVLAGGILCLRADKPSPYAGKQLALNLEYV